MKQIITFLIIGLVCSLSLTSCQKIINIGPEVTEERDLKDFTDVETKGSFNVLITQGNEYSVVLKGGKNILGVIETTVKSKQLLIKVKSGRSIPSSAEITVYITMPEVHDLEVSGSGDIELENDLITTDINLKVSGSGNIRVPYLEATNLDAKISGSGRIEVEGGKVHRENLNIKGSGDIDAYDLMANKAKVKITGSGNVYVYVVEHLDVEITGSGDVHYRGDPTVETRVSGSGRVIHD